MDRHSPASSHLMWLCFLVVFKAGNVLAGTSTTLSCFSSADGAVKSVDASSTVCSMELNLFNLGCLSPPLMTLFDVETNFASLGMSSKLPSSGGKRRTVCFREDHYVKCYCAWNECNTGWKFFNHWGKANVSNDKQLTKCVHEKCNQGDLCASYGTKNAKKLNFYALPLDNTASPKEKKAIRMGVLEMVTLWATGGGVLLTVISFVVYSLLASGTRPPAKRTLPTPGKDKPAASVSSMTEKPPPATSQFSTKEKEPVSQAKPSAKMLAKKK